MLQTELLNRERVAMGNYDHVDYKNYYKPGDQFGMPCAYFQRGLHEEVCLLQLGDERLEAGWNAQR